MDSKHLHLKCFNVDRIYGQSGAFALCLVNCKNIKDFVNKTINKNKDWREK